MAFPTVAQTGTQDYFVYKTGDTIFCQFTKVRNQHLHYTTKEKQQTSFSGTADQKKEISSGTLGFYDCLDIFISSNTQKLLKLNPIQKKEKGTTLIYFYNPNQKPTSTFVIYKDNKKVMKLKKNSYGLVKLKNGQWYTFYIKTGYGRNIATYYTDGTTQFIRAFVNPCKRPASEHPNKIQLFGDLLDVTPLPDNDDADGDCGKNLRQEYHPFKMPPNVMDQFAEIQVMSMLTEATYYNKENQF